MYKKTGGGFVVLAILLAGCLFVLGDAFTPDDEKSKSFFNPGIFKVVFGIDLRGGAELLYRLDLETVDPATRRNLPNDVKDVMIKRLNQFGTSERTISVVGTDKLLVELPGADGGELERVKTAIQEAGELSFNLVADTQGAALIEALKEQWALYDQRLREFNSLSASERAAAFAANTAPQPPDKAVVTQKPAEGAPEGTVGADLIIDKTQEVAGKWLTGAYRTFDQSQLPAIGFEFSNVGRTQFADLTGENVGKRLAIVLDGVAISVANINSRILGPGILEGVDDAEISTVIPILKAGSLPTKPILVNQTSIGSVLGRDSIAQAQAALLVSFLLVIVMMIVIYIVPGAVADLSLVLNLVILLSFMIVFRNTLTLPGMAGLLLTIGMSVDANILIFERIREEKDRGKSLNQAVQSGYQRAFWTIFDANLTTLITAFILFKFGTGPVKGFAVVLSLGIMVSFFTALFVSRLVLSVLMKRQVVTELRMLQVLKSPSFDFLQYRKPAMMVSCSVIVLGMGVLAVRGQDNLGIDFTGGSRLVLNLKSPVKASDIRTAIAGIEQNGKKLFGDVQIQAVGESTDRGASAYSVRTRTDDADLLMVMGTAEAQSSPAPTLATAPAGAGEKKQLQPQEVFRNKVAERLGDLLAPAGYLPHEITEAGSGLKALSQVWNLKRDTDPVQASQVADLLRDKGFPVADNGVTPFSDSTALGDNYVAFKITSEPVPETRMLGLPSELSKIMNEHSGFSVSNPFPHVDAIGGKVAQDLQANMFVAMAIAILAIIFYVSLRFQFKFGLAAVVALVHDILFVTAVMAIGDTLLGGVMSLKINLPVVAALLTVVGYSLNDTIVIFDRIRENVADKKRGFDYLAVVNQSINQTLTRTLLTSATTFVVVLMLLVWGGSSIQAFAFALCVGVLVGTFSSIYIASPALIYFNDRSEKRREALLREAGGK